MNQGWEHLAGYGTILGAIGLLWRKINKHVKEFRIRLNGYTIHKERTDK